MRINSNHEDYNLLCADFLFLFKVWDGRRFAQTDAQKDYDSVVDLRDSVLHAKLRKPWNQAFSSEPLKDYELLLIPRVAQLLEILKGACLRDRDGIGRVNIAKWIGCFTYVIL